MRSEAGIARGAWRWLFASPLPLAIIALIQFKVITRSTGLALAAAPLIIDALGWRAVAPIFDRERLITGVRT
ncbi:MAG: hypothetical protein ACRDLP_03970 [Solirubrobacteraceae bacterium]